MTRWRSGQDRITELLAAGLLERSDGGIADGRERLARAEAHLARLRAQGADEPDEPDVRGDLAYRAMAASAIALLVAQGLRQTPAGGLAAVQAAVTAQFSGGPVPGVFDSLSQISVPPSAQTDARTIDERADAAATAAEWAVTYATRLLGADLLHRFTDDRILKV